MLISKKKYQALIAERDAWEKLATETSAQNGRLLTELKEMHAIAKTVKMASAAMSSILVVKFRLTSLT